MMNYHVVLRGGPTKTVSVGPFVVRAAVGTK
jgi:hypothetical protein